MIIKTYGGGSSKELLRTLTNTSSNGTTAYDIIKAAEYFNFNSYGLKCNICDINEIDLPVIAHVVIENKYKHFIVIYKINKTKNIITIADPNNNKIINMKIEDFNKISSNNFIFFKPTKKIKKIKPNKSLKKLFVNNIVKNKKLIIILFLLSILVSILCVITSYYFQFIIDTAINKNNTFLIPICFIVFTIISISKNIVNYIKNKLLIRCNNILDISLFDYVYNKFLHLPYFYLKNRTTGEVLSRIKDLSSVRTTFSKAIVSLFIDVFLILIPLIFLIIINKILSIFIIIMLVLILLVFIIFKNKIKRLIIEIKEDNSIVNSNIIETISGIETINNLNINNITYKKITTRYNDLIKKTEQFSNLLNKKNTILDLLNEIFLILIITLGSYFVLNNNLSISNMITYYFLGSIMLESTKNIIEFIIDCIDTSSSFFRLRELCDIEEDDDNNEHYINGFNIENIIYKNVSYSYKREKLIENINLSINKGERILLTGKSGVGKSTLMKLIEGNMKDYKGQILINGISLKNISKINLKERITYISQNEYIFTDTIRNNIISDRNVSNEDLDKIYKILNINDNNFIEDNLVEENGFNISGGQRQRIIIARALLKNSDIYILDESLCNLDIKLEREILRKIFENYKDKTFIVVSHRFNNKDLFNKIINL